MGFLDFAEMHFMSAREGKGVGALLNRSAGPSPRP
jgi:hypothetical protein